MWLTADQVEELKCLKQTTNIVGPTFIHCSNWRGLYQGIVQRGLVTWAPHPSMSEKFRRVELTRDGLSLLASLDGE